MRCKSPEEKLKGITLKLPDYITYRDTFHCDSEKSAHNSKNHIR
jgi:hypothetical protein